MGFERHQYPAGFTRMLQMGGQVHRGADGAIVDPEIAAEIADIAKPGMNADP